MVRRGEIHWVELPPSTGSEQVGIRPALIIQNDAGNRSSTTTIVVAITSQPRRRLYPFHVSFTAEESGLNLGGTVLCEQVFTVDQNRLQRLIGALPQDRMRDVDVALHRSLGLDH
jgi:mRNA interferase MazF